MTDLQTFSSAEFGEIKAIEKDGQVLFVAKDVCECLGLTNTTMAIQRLEVDEVTKLNLGGLSGETNFVNEYGLYNLILASRKQEAKLFKRWITHEVLPSIRQNGGYISPQAKGLDYLQAMLDQMKQQDAEIRQANERSQKAIETTQSIRSAIVEEYDNWRKDICHKVSKLQKSMNKSYQDTWSELYERLEEKAHCDLGRRIDNARFRLQERGAKKSSVDAYCRMDVIESDVRLKEIFTAIVREYAVKYAE